LRGGKISLLDSAHDDGPRLAARSDLEARAEQEKQRKTAQQMPDEMGADLAVLELVRIAQRKIERTEGHRDRKDQRGLALEEHMLAQAH